MRIDKKHLCSDKPFFSVIIPTRNRPNLVACAINTVLNQTFFDYELIVSDNSDNAEATKDAIHSIPKWHDNPRLRYVRPQHYMNMADHWDFATGLATGSYVAILTDRFVMRPSALEILAKEIRAHQTGEPDLVVWNMQSSYSEQSGMQTTAEFSGRVESIVSREMLADFVKFSSWRSGEFYFNKLPRGLNSIYKRSLAEKVIERHGRMFFPNSPDYTSAFMLLAYSEKVFYLDLPLYIAHGNQSGGMTCAIYGIHKLDTDIDFFEGCPLPLDTVFNSVVRDFLAIKKMVYLRLKSFEIDMVGYYLSNYAEFIVKESLGSPMDLQSLYQLWHQGVEELPFNQQSEIKKNMKILDEMRPTPIKLLKQKTFRKLGLNNLRDYLRAVQSKFNHKRSGGMIYGNVIEAANATDYFIRKKCSIMENGKL